MPPGAVAAKQPPSLLDFTNTFVLTSTPNLDQVLSEVPKALSIDPYRQRRAHQKSRAGCANCRRRRIKCNEETPCESCARRGERCQRPVHSSRAPSIPSTPTQALPPSAESTDAVVNLMHMKLFHHFQAYTRPTLLFAPEAWGLALQLCFQLDFLMNAVLCIAARHLSILQPEDTTYSAAAASHLCRALFRFRHALSNDFPSCNIDAFVATSFLLQYDVWTSTDFFSPRNDGAESFDPARDRIFALSSGLKQVFLKAIPHTGGISSVFLSHIQRNPMDALTKSAQISDGTLAKYQDFFAYRHPLPSELLDMPLPYVRGAQSSMSKPWQRLGHSNPDGPDAIEDGYAPVIDRLCLILSFLPEANPPDSVDSSSPLLPDLARYIFSFPVQCHGAFASMVQKGDPHALLLLYHFYRAVRILLSPGEYWWAHQRAIVSETALKEWLSRKTARNSPAPG